MKILKFLIIAAVFIFAGYVLGNLFPFASPEAGVSGEGITGDTELAVAVFDGQNAPIQNLEVDLAETPGPPPQGGTAQTDENGVAVFKVKPGKYFIYFNSSNFPAPYEFPEPERVEVKDGENSSVIILKNR